MGLLGELKRRNVFRVTAAYLVFAWLLLQVLDVVGPILGLPDVIARYLLFLLVVGIVPAIVIAWVFEFTPDGLARDAAVDLDSAVIKAATKRLDRIFMFALALAVGYFAFDKFMLDPARDAATLPLTRRALQAGVPIMAVCRGFQEVVVALGGTLHQKVHEVSGYHNHRENPDDPLEVQYGPSHNVNLVEGGVLHALAGSSNVSVNSLHSQGVAKLPNGVTVEAVADDGLIEAFTVNGVPGFSMAVQWHPEWRTREKEFSMAIFNAFGDACREYAGHRQVQGE